MVASLSSTAQSCGLVGTWTATTRAARTFFFRIISIDKTIFPRGAGFRLWLAAAPPPPPSSGEPMFVSFNVLSPISQGLVGVQWIVDSGATVHLVNDLSLLHNPVMHSQPLPLHLATSDAKGGIIASGSVCLLSKPLSRPQIVML